jgi:phage shock protein C
LKIFIFYILARFMLRSFVSGRVARQGAKPMQTSQPSLLMRDDTFFGVCQGLGEDFGFNPLYLRILFSVGLLWNPVATLAAYALCGAIVMLGRWLFPASARAGTSRAAARATADDKPLEDDGNAEPDEYSVAA